MPSAVRGVPFVGAVLLASFALTAQDPIVRVLPLQPAAGTAWMPTRSLTVQVEIVHPADVDDEAPTAPLTLAPASRSWPASVTLRADAANGAALAWSFARSPGDSEPPRTLRRGQPIPLLFTLAADPGRTLAAPSCTLRAELAIPDGTGWRGRIASAPVEVAVAAAAPPPAGVLDLSLVAAPVLSPGEAWIVAIELPPPVVGSRDDDLRAGYVLRWRDASGKELPLAPAFVATPPKLPDARELRERGFGPVFAVFAPSATKDLPPGLYSLAVEHRAGDQRSRGELSCRMVPAADDEVRLPGPALSGPVALAPGQRDAARLEVHLAHAQALLWHAEFGDSAHVERTATAAAAVLRTAEQLALARHSFAALAEVSLRMGDFEAAGAFARTALGLWTPPPPVDGAPVAAAPDELRSLLAAVERGAPPASVRVMPYLRAALAASAGGEPGVVGAPGTTTIPNPGTPANGTPAANGLLRQWARSARASSEYRSTDYAAAQATGAPDVTKAGDNGKAWAPKLADGGEEWLEVTFAQAVRATELRVVQNHAPGAIVRIDAIGADGAAVAVWTGPDPTAYAPRTIGVLSATLAGATAPVATFRIVLDSKRVADWNEIDAVELIGRRD